MKVCLRYEVQDASHRVVAQGEVLVRSRTNATLRGHFTRLQHQLWRAHSYAYAINIQKVHS